MRATIPLLLALACVGPLYAQANTAFKGRPEVKVQENGLQRLVEPIPREAAVNLECVISLIGGRYYWASRENIELIRVESRAFIVYMAANGAGYIKIIKSELKDAAALMGDAEARFDYVEHLSIGLATVTYYGQRAPN